jgi:hypothetical protein
MQHRAYDSGGTNVHDSTIHTAISAGQHGMRLANTDFNQAQDFNIWARVTTHRYNGHWRYWISHYFNNNGANNFLSGWMMGGWADGTTKVQGGWIRFNSGVTFSMDLMALTVKSF